MPEPKTAATEEKPHWSEDVNWDVILDSIRGERCVLCVGPGVYTEDGQTLEQRLTSYLRHHAERLKIRVYDDGWFHYLPGSNVIEPHSRVKAFFRQPFPRAERIFSLLASIKFHFLVSVIPDYKLSEAFGDKPHSFDAYRKLKPFDPAVERPSAARPIVYNMMGEIDKRESLVLTYDDFYTFLQSIFEGRSMAPILKTAIAEADNFIFLGMPFDRWHMHLLLRILEQHKNTDRLKYSPGQLLDEKIRMRCEEEFNITFVPVDIEDFARELRKRAEAVGLLRDEGEAGDAPQRGTPRTRRLRQLIGSAQLDTALAELLDWLAGLEDVDRDLLNAVITIKSNYEGSKQRRQLNLMDEEEFSRKSAEATHGLLAQIDQLEESLSS